MSATLDHLGTGDPSHSTATPARSGASRWTGLFSAAALAVLYFVLNPYFFGDATWYALDIAAGSGTRVDAGHLLWRPLGQGAWIVVHALGARDPLTGLRVLSSVAAAALVALTYVIARRLGFNGAAAAGAAVLVAGSKMALAYGGSGCSYLPAATLGLAAMLPLARVRQRIHATDTALSAAALTLAWGMWGIVGLLLPAQLVLAWMKFDGPLVRRALRVAILAAATLGAILALAVAGYLAVPGIAHDVHGFMGWLRASGHGDPPKLSVVAFARAGIGFFNSFVHLGAFGTSVKGLLLRDPQLVHPATLLAYGPVLAMFTLAVLFACVGLVRGLVRGERWRAPAAVLALAALVPIGAFAATWRGSDVERFSFAVAFFALLLVDGVAARTTVAARRALPLVFPVVLALANLALFVVPALASRGGVIMDVGRTARTHLSENDLLVVNGRELGPDVVSAAVYFAKLDVYSVSYELQTFGAAGWHERLDAALCKAVARGARIAVISDLLGRATPGGIGYSPAEFPTPTSDELVRALAGWEPAGPEWTVDRFRFVMVRPTSASACPPPRPSGGR